MIDAQDGAGGAGGDEDGNGARCRRRARQGGFGVIRPRDYPLNRRLSRQIFSESPLQKIGISL
jgi:hypothetical protein